MQVVAEGVETDAQARLLQKINCDELQGFLIAKPMAAEDVGQFIAAQPSATESPATEMAAAEVSSDIVYVS